MATDRASSVARALRRLRVALRVAQVLGILAYFLVTVGSAGPTPGPPWSPTWPGRVITAGVMLVSAGLFAEVAGRKWDRPAYRRVWVVLAGVYVALAAAFLIGQSTLETPAELRDAPSYFALAGVVFAAVAGLLMVRERVPPMPADVWIEVVGVTLGVLALSTAATGLALRPEGASPPPMPEVRIGLYAILVLSALLAGAAAVTRTRTTRPLARFSVGMLLVAASSVAHEALTEHDVALAPAIGGSLMLSGFALAAWAATPDPAREPVSWLRPGERRRRGPMLGSPRLQFLPTVLSGTSVLLVAVTLVEAELRETRPGLVHLDLPWCAALLALGCLAVRLLRLAVAQRIPGGFGSGVSLSGLDDMTGLADRRTLTRALDGDPDLLDIAGDEAWVSLAIVDVDRFKEVNDGLGHDAGDRVLIEVGRRLRTVLRPHQMLARLAGDEFAVLLPGADAEAALRVAADLRACMAEPFEIDGNRLHLTASVGIAAVRPGLEPADDLLRRADVAVDVAKTAQDGTQVYDPRRDDGLVGPGRLRRIDELRDALANGDLEVHLQPQVDLRTGRVTGAEALARWRHPQDGVLLPDAFLPLAAQVGLMRPVAAIVLEKALESCARWRAEGHEVTVSVNVTADDLRDPDLPGLVEETLRRHGVPASSLVVEITEDALLTDPQAAARVLERWRADGVSIAVDDYGTGYSSLAYLRELPVDEVKLDQVFAADLARARTETIVEHTVAMAHGLRLRVVVEGIEDETTSRAVAALGADVGQGLLFGDAMTPEEFLRTLGERERSGSTNAV